MVEPDYTEANSLQNDPVYQLGVEAAREKYDKIFQVVDMLLEGIHSHAEIAQRAGVTMEFVAGKAAIFQRHPPLTAPLIQRITIATDTPTIRDTGVSVLSVISRLLDGPDPGEDSNWFLIHRSHLETILRQYPGLEQEDILACKVFVKKWLENYGEQAT